MTGHFALNRKKYRCQFFTQSLKIALTLGEDQIGGLECPNKAGAAIGQDGTRRVRAIIDHCDHRIQTSAAGILPGGIVEDGPAADRQGHAFERQPFDQQPVKKDLARIIRDVENPLCLRDFTA